jgi:hypothetical protein
MHSDGNTSTPVDGNARTHDSVACRTSMQIAMPSRASAQRRPGCLTHGEPGPALRSGPAWTCGGFVTRAGHPDTAPVAHKKGEERPAAWAAADHVRSSRWGRSSCGCHATADDTLRTPRVWRGSSGLSLSVEGLARLGLTSDGTQRASRAARRCGAHIHTYSDAATKTQCTGTRATAPTPCKVQRIVKTRITGCACAADTTTRQPLP